MFELVDALLCVGGPVGAAVTPMLAGLLVVGPWFTLWQLVDVFMG